MSLRAYILTSLMAFGLSAHAQFSIGPAPSAQCPYGFAPGQGAINGNDEVSNLQGRFDQRKAELDRVQDELDGLDDKFARSREDMGRVLSTKAVAAIEDHRTFKRGYYDYYDCPKNPGAVASAGGSGTATVLPKRGRQANPGGSDNTSQVYPSDEFCVRGKDGTTNTWANFVDDDGKFSDEVCDYNVPTYQGRPNKEDSRDCKEGMHDYFRLVARREALEKKRAQLDADCRALERKLDRIEEEVAEGRYCPYCNNERRGYSNGGLADSIVPMFGVLSQAGGGLFNQQRQQAPQYAPFPGPGAYPGNPYPAVTPGYMGVYNGVYGGMPGGIGRGAFGCEGTNPMAGNPYATSAMPYLGGQQSRLINPYQLPLQNPQMQSSLLNPGFGPGFAPVLGNGVNNYQLMNPNLQLQQQGNPFLNLGQQAPYQLPYQGAQPNYFQQPYQFTQNPYARVGGGVGGGQFAPGTPVMTPFGPGVIPGGGIVNPYGWGNAYGYGNPGSYGAPSQMNNLYLQMQRMGNSLGSIYGSPYMGGGGAPYQLPYPGPAYGLGGGGGAGYNYNLGYGGGGGYNYNYNYGFGGGFSSPIYNIPGSGLNPLPPVTNPGGGGTTAPGGIIRSR